MKVIMKFKDGSKLIRYKVKGGDLYSEIIYKDGMMLRSIPTKGYGEGSLGAEICDEHLSGEMAIVYRHLLEMFVEEWRPE